MNEMSQCINRNARPNNNQLITYYERVSYYKELFWVTVFLLPDFSSHNYFLWTRPVCRHFSISVSCRSLCIYLFQKLVITVPRFTIFGLFKIMSMTTSHPRCVKRMLQRKKLHFLPWINIHKNWLKLASLKVSKVYF